MENKMERDGDMEESAPSMGMKDTPRPRMTSGMG